MGNNTFLQRFKRLNFSKILFNSFLITLVINGFLLFLKDKCSFITCEIATWSTVQEIAIKHTNTWNDEYRLSNMPVLIFKHDDNGLNLQTLLENTEISVDYVSTRETGNQQGIIYSTRTIRFDDSNLWITDRGGLAKSLPSDRTLKLFEQVQVGYRDVINITWNKANDIINLPIRSVLIKLILADESLEDIKDKSVWQIQYMNKEETIWYWIDTQNGQIIKSGKN